MPETDPTGLLTQIAVRSVNEWIREANRAFGPSSAMDRYRCECGDPACDTTIELTEGEYEAVRAESTRFVVTVNHEDPGECVISEQRRFAIVGTIDAWDSRAASEADEHDRP